MKLSMTLENLNSGRLDRLPLRILLFVSLGALIAGQVMTYAFKGMEEIGAWIILGSSCFGLVFSLAYCADILWHRLRLSLAALLLLIVIHVISLTVVSHAFAWLNGDARGRAAPAAHTLNMLFLGLATLGVLLRWSVLALLSASWWGEGWAGVLLAARFSKAGQEGEKSPRAWVWTLFLLSPLAWWLALWSGLYLYTQRDSRTAMLELFEACILVIAVRLSLGIWSMVKALGEYRNARRVGDGSAVRKARWFLLSSGLPAAGLLSFYSFCVAATRVQHDALTNMLQGEEARHVAELRLMQPPTLPPEENAQVLYEKAVDQFVGAYGNSALQAVYDDKWNSKQAAAHVLSNSAALDLFRKGAKRAHCDWQIDFGEEPKTYRDSGDLAKRRDLLTCLILEGRLAAWKGDWKPILENVEAALKLCEHQHSGSLVDCLIAESYEGDVIDGLLAAVFWAPESQQPRDVDMAEAQRILRNHLARRGKPMARAFRLVSISALRGFDREWILKGEAWPGSVDVLGLLWGQPMLQWTDRLFCLDAYASAAQCLEENGGMIEFYRQSESVKKRAWHNRPLERILPSIHRCAECDFEVLSLFHLADAALGVARFRGIHNKLPSSLEECVPQYLSEVPSDPYKMGSSVKYLSEAPRVFCAGPDGIYEPEHHDTELRGSECLTIWHPSQTVLKDGTYKGDQIILLDRPKEKAK